MTDQAQAGVGKAAKELLGHLQNNTAAAGGYYIDPNKALADVLAFAESAVNAERERLDGVVRQLNARAGTSFLNCDEISAYRLACEHVVTAIRQPEAREDMEERESNP